MCVETSRREALCYVLPYPADTPGVCALAWWCKWRYGTMGDVSQESLSTLLVVDTTVAMPSGEKSAGAMHKGGAVHANKDVLSGRQGRRLGGGEACLVGSRSSSIHGRTGDRSAWWCWPENRHGDEQTRPSGAGEVRARLDTVEVDGQTWGRQPAADVMRSLLIKSSVRS